MQIGKFALLCQTKISVLRHYDKEGLLVPDTVDKFTGYRYYSAMQRERFLRIQALKGAGFTLPEIREILTGAESDDEILRGMEAKKASLIQKLKRLSEVKKMLKENKEFKAFEDF